MDTADVKVTHIIFSPLNTPNIDFICTVGEETHKLYLNKYTFVIRSSETGDVVQDENIVVKMYQELLKQLAATDIIKTVEDAIRNKDMSIWFYAVLSMLSIFVNMLMYSHFILKWF